MSSKSSDNDTTHPSNHLDNEIALALNDEGYLFQKYCARKIQESGWVIDAEEYPISDTLSLDLKVTKFTNETSREIAVIEVKRQDPERKRWIFFKDEKISQAPFFFQGHVLNTLSSGRYNKREGVVRSVMECLSEEELEMPQYHTVGVEIYKDFKNQATNWKSNSEIIFKSCFNVALGVNHLFDAEANALHRTIRYGIKRLEKEKKTFRWQYWLGGCIIPIVITSAPLVSVAFDPESMDISTFKVNFDNISSENQKWLVYDFPLPKSLQYNPTDVRQMFSEDRYAKMQIFIVNGKYVAEFFNKLSNSIKQRSKKSGRVLTSSYTDFYEPKEKDGVPIFWGLRH
jgi:hypothetical protein